MTIALKNISRSMQVLNFTREAVPRRAVFQRFVTHVDGTQDRRDVRVMLGGSVILAVGETRGGFPGEARLCPDIRAAVLAKTIEVFDEVEATTEEVDVVVDEQALPVNEETVDESPTEEDVTREAPAEQSTKHRGKVRTAG